MHSYFTFKNAPYTNYMNYCLPQAYSTYFGTNSVHFKARLLWNRLSSSLKSVPEFRMALKILSILTAQTLKMTEVENDNYSSMIIWKSNNLIKDNICF